MIMLLILTIDITTLQVIGPVLCGPNMNKYEKDPCPDAMYNHQSNSRALELMLYVMTNNPLIVYAPRGPDVDAVVTRVCKVLIHILILDYYHNHSNNTSN